MPLPDHLLLGQKGEELAVAFLKKAGMEILDLNWRSRREEVDIVAKDKSFLVIAEVKTRSSNVFGDPEVFVNRLKQKNLIAAAQEYLIKKKLDLEVRFDIISVLNKPGGPEITHIKDAFSPTVS